MTKETPAQTALATLRKAVKDRFSRLHVQDLAAAAEVEVRAEQVRQQELANMIAMLANPSACPYPKQDVLARIKELTNLG